MYSDYSFFFHHKKNLIVKTASLNSILFYVCRSFGHVNWPQLSDWCVILDRQLCSALYSVFKHSGDSSVSCQHVGLWDSIVQMLLSQTRRFHCQRELAALIKHHYMCHYACAWALCKVFGPLHPVLHPTRNDLQKSLYLWGSFWYYFVLNIIKVLTMCSYQPKYEDYIYCLTGFTSVDTITWVWMCDFKK